MFETIMEDKDLDFIKNELYAVMKNLKNSKCNNASDITIRSGYKLQNEVAHKFWTMIKQKNEDLLNWYLIF